MRKHIILLFALGFMAIQSVSAQDSHKVIDSCHTMLTYDYQFYTISKDPQSLKRQEMVLEIGKKYSKFFSKKDQYKDSLVIAYDNQPMEVAVAAITPLITNVQGHKYASMYVYKGYPEPDITLFTASDEGAANHFSVSEKLDFGWKIDNTAKETILGMSCTKATCRFAGRDYVAWFTTEIPINDGPYKFRGLPGLVVKLADSENEHVFELQAVKTVSNKPMYFSNQKYIATDGKGYVNALEASKASFADKLSTMVKDEALRARVVANVQRRNNFIEQY